MSLLSKIILNSMFESFIDFDLKKSTKRTQLNENQILFKEQKIRARHWPLIAHDHIHRVMIYRTHSWKYWLRHMIRQISESLKI